MRKRMHPLRTLTLRGFSIVEAMVALLVLSVGMLGIAGLYVTTLRASGSALFRTHAVNLAADMADRIRANPNAGNAYAGAGADNGCAGGGVDCSQAQLAADDVFTWLNQIAAILPDDGDANTAQGTVAVAGANPRTYTITVSWVEPTEPQPLSYVLRMQI
ncbi:MAG TPA: type IV pilus modification protein PilV [Steroidobacteraceae bacterium]